MLEIRVLSLRPIRGQMLFRLGLLGVSFRCRSSNSGLDAVVNAPVDCDCQCDPLMAGPRFCLFSIMYDAFEVSLRLHCWNSSTLCLHGVFD